mgnify:CR=1 FL=1
MNEWLIDFVYLVSNSIHSYINQERILDLIFSLHLSLSLFSLFDFIWLFHVTKGVGFEKKTKIFFIFMSIQKTTSNITDDDDNDDSWPFMFITHKFIIFFIQQQQKQLQFHSKKKKSISSTWGIFFCLKN